MNEDASLTERSGARLVFVSGGPGLGAIIVAVVVFATLVGFAASGKMSDRESAAPILALLFFALILFVSLSRQWIAEIDLKARRLRISRQYFGRWPKMTVDRPLDEFDALGTIEYNTEGHRSYDVYVQSRQGKRHAIPLNNSTFAEAAHVATQLSAATGIPRLDTTYP